MTDIPEAVDMAPMRTQALHYRWVEFPKGVRYTAQWLVDRGSPQQDPLIVSQPHNSDATFKCNPSRFIPRPSAFLLDAAYGAAVVARYSDIAPGDPGQLQKFPRYRARPNDDSDYHPSDEESGASNSSRERASTPRRTHYYTSHARSGASPSADPADEPGNELDDDSEDELEASPLWGPFFSVLSLFAKDDQSERRDAVERWRVESGAPANWGIST